MTSVEVSATSDLGSLAGDGGEGQGDVVVVLPVGAGEELQEVVPPGFDVGFAERSGFTGRPGQAVAVPARPVRGPGVETPIPASVGAVVLVGTGKEAAGAPGRREPMQVERLRRAGATAVRTVWRARRLVIDLRGVDVASRHPAWCAQAVAEGAILATYRFDPYKSDPGQGAALEHLTVVSRDAAEAGRGARRGARVSDAVALARDLVNRPAGDMTPSRLAEECGEVAARSGLGVEVLDEGAILEEGMGALTGVSLGSAEPPRLVKLFYEPAPPLPPAPSSLPTVALVGKGITFDSGGLSLKSPEAMMVQKTDMGGAAAVLAAMSALRDLGAGVRVLGFLPLTENMPGPGALKPGDVVRARNSKTIEVLNTDAEGRLVLSDALSLAAEESPAAIVDLATLTGACVVALGKAMAGLMGNHEGLMEQVRHAGDVAGETVWPLPLPEEYRGSIDSDVADMKNVGIAGQAGALAGGLLLKEFVADVPWAHLDIAGPARSDKDEGYLRKGATGFGTRALIELISSFEMPGLDDVER